METISVRDLRKRIRSVMDTAQRDQVVITRNGQPVAVVVGIEGVDRETVAVETSRSFWSRCGAEDSATSATHLIVCDPRRDPAVDCA